MRYAPEGTNSIDDLDTDTVYVNDETSEAVVTVDGIGFYYFDTEEDALKGMGHTAEDAYLIPCHDYEEMLANHY